MLPRVFATGFLTICCLSQALADSVPFPTPSPDAIAITASAPATSKPFKPFLASLHISPAEGAVIGLQALDSATTARCIRTGWCFETNHTVRPFSHGGAVEMFGAFLAADLVRNYLLRHAGKRIQTAALLLQAATNVEGITQTNRAINIINSYKAEYCNVYIEC